MQESVPYYFLRKSRKRQGKRAIGFLLSFVFVAVIVAVSLAFAFKPKSDSFLGEKKFYFVYTNFNLKKDPLSDEQELIKKLGGSGVLMLHDNRYYLIANVYFSSEEAEEIKENINKSFPNCGIITVTESLSKAQKRAVKSNENVYACFRFFSKFLIELQANSMKYIAGSLSESGLCSEIMAKKLEIAELIKENSKNSDELGKKVLSNLSLAEKFLSNFFDEFFNSNKKQAVLAQLTVNLSLSWCNLIDNL